MGAPTVSVVIPTFNRQERLRRVLAALAAQSATPDSFEVVVVDDGSTDGTSSWLASQKPPFALRVVSQTNAGPARARNAGIEAAQGRLLLFIDDDVEPLPELVAAHVESHAREERVVVMGPLGTLPYYRQPWVSWEQAKVEAQYAAMTRGDWEPSFRQFWTGNASVSRAEVVDAGRFNPEFLRAEDVELAYRLHLRGMKFRFNPNARAMHHAERSLASWEKMHASYGQLEVQIFSLESERALLEILAGNWARLHPATRKLVRHCTTHPRSHRAVSQTFRSWLEAAARLPKPLLADKVSSAFANLIYWTASFEALGPERTRVLLERAAELKRTGRRDFPESERAAS